MVSPRRSSTLVEGRICATAAADDPGSYPAGKINNSTKILYAGHRVRIVVYTLGWPPGRCRARGQQSLSGWPSGRQRCGRRCGAPTGGNPGGGLGAPMGGNPGGGLGAPMGGNQGGGLGAPTGGNAGDGTTPGTTPGTVPGAAPGAALGAAPAGGGGGGAMRPGRTLSRLAVPSSGLTSGVPFLRPLGLTLAVPLLKPVR